VRRVCSAPLLSLARAAAAPSGAAAALAVPRSFSPHEFLLRKNKNVARAAAFRNPPRPRRVASRVVQKLQFLNNNRLKKKKKNMGFLRKPMFFARLVQ
jgi:hypothetical protein